MVELNSLMDRGRVILFAQSKLMQDSVPRNELSAIVLMAESALTVMRALNNRVKEVWYFSDSVIAICWVLNKEKRLRMWVFNRVLAARTAMNWTVGGEKTLPLYHIPGKENLADLLTKPCEINAVDLMGESP